MELNFFYSITLLSLFITFVLSSFFFITKKGNRNENIILALLLLLFNIQIFYSFTASLYASQYFVGYHKITYLLRQASFLTGPLIYLYINSILKRNGTLKRINLIHFVPFLTSLLFLTVYYSYKDEFIIWKSDIHLYDTILILSHNLIYIILSILNLKSSNIKLTSFFNRNQNSSPITWLQILLLGYIILWIINLNSFATVMIIQKAAWCAFTTSIYALALFIFMNCITFLLLLKPEIYFVIEKYKYNSIDETTKSVFLKKLQDYMGFEKPYLKPDISLEILGKELDINTKTLSQIINESFHCNFKRYINEFRLKECINLLSDQKNDDKTILEILYSVGFNSKSVFNNQFKKYTGLTPQEFRAERNNLSKEELPAIP